MSTEEISVVSSQNGINSQLVFQDEPLRFNCGAPQRRVGDPGPKTRELTGFIDDKLFSSSTGGGRDSYFPTHHQVPEFARTIYRVDRRDPPDSRDWNGNGHGHGTSGDESDGEEDDEDDEVDDDDDDVDDGDGDHENGVEALVTADNNGNNNDSTSNKNNGSNTTTATATNIGDTGSLDKMGNGKPTLHSSFGTGSELMAMKDGGASMEHAANNAVTMAEPVADMYYSQYLQEREGSGVRRKDTSVENGCRFSGRKEFSSFSSESGESLRSSLSDPVTGSLMDDAVILPCGHSFGGGGMQHVIRMKVCYTCSQSISEESIAPNLSLRAAVQAFRLEEEVQYRSSKRRRERFDQDKGSYGDSTLMDPPRGRGVQFPFSVTDRVIIKGNKRTPQRFVGREAVVTTQCLNGWYVVKTLDNAESVKLQYRSLAKVSEDPSSKALSSKMGPNWP